MIKGKQDNSPKKMAVMLVDQVKLRIPTLPLHWCIESALMTTDRLIEETRSKYWYQVRKSLIEWRNI